MTPSSEAINGTKRVETKEQHEKHEKFVWTLFLFFSQKRKPVLKEKRGMKEEWLRKE